MTEEELRLFNIKLSELKSKGLLTLDDKSKDLIDRMNLQYKNHKKNLKTSKKQKVATVFYPGV
jgi:hypothetical protein